MEFSSQEYWSGCHPLLQQIFLTQGLNPGLQDCRWILNRLYHLSHQRSPSVATVTFPYRKGLVTAQQLYLCLCFILDQNEYLSKWLKSKDIRANALSRIIDKIQLS